MTRMLVTIHERDKAWLEQYSRLHHQSMAETVRQAVHSYRDRGASQSAIQVLRETAGIWRHRGKDGLEHQRELRGEWEGGGQ